MSITSCRPIRRNDRANAKIGKEDPDAPRPERTEKLAQLTRQIHDGTISRRAFMARALALGLSVSAGDMIFRTYRAGAQDQAENPITVTVGGTPIAAMETDLSNATPGGTFRFGRADDSDNLDPIITDVNSSIWYFMNIYDQLVRVAPDGISLVPESGRELGYLRRRSDLHLPPAPECALL